MHTACVVGKNYRLQDIQLSKMPLSLAERLTLRVLSAYYPHSRLQAQAVSGELAESAGRTNLTSLRRGPRPKLVENTGLEPVTSWLQTRRSPS
jgi:hypothetical protein